MKFYPFLLLLLSLFGCQSTSTKDDVDRMQKEITTPSSATDQNPSTSAPVYTTPSVSEHDPYEMMHVAFEGEPEIDKIKPLIETILERYKMPINDEFRLKVGSMLIDLRKNSKVGVTEMDILKHIYQNYTPNISLPDQAGLSSTLLENSK